MSDAVIQIENLRKRYRLGELDPYRNVRGWISASVSAPFRWATGRPAAKPRSGPEYMWALDGISLEVAQGEVVGIIGANGAGKTTLLKVLSRITEPTSGTARIRGRIGSLLEVGTGFHQELTGRENVHLSGVILGMKRAEIRRKFDHIVEFAGVEQFIDTPVKRYSSGMQVRLAFSVAVHLDTEILLVDEVLAVGDAVFQLRSLEKMSEIASGGRTVLFVSHNMETIARLCQRGVLLDKGQVVLDGTPQECISQYLSAVRKSTGNDGQWVSLEERSGKSKQGGGPVRLTRFAVVNEQGLPQWNMACGGRLTAKIGYRLEAGAARQNVMFSITIANVYNHRIANCRSHDTFTVPFVVDGEGTAVCVIDRLPLRPGIYKFHVSCMTEAGPSDGVYEAATVEVEGTDFYPSGQVPAAAHGEVLFEHSWSKEPSEQLEIESALAHADGTSSEEFAISHQVPKAA
ncbi:MAG: ABC transporter ATP-binding protein [Chloroflexi bacterium]|nr:ABC transporter ATP-binding protein [Chloroflexota bacterium]